MKKIKNVLMIILIVIMFIIIAYLDTDSTTKESYIRDAQVQAEINKASK